ncbi:hypothetical protein KCU68_g110, partial [Aureobasidium melanogenum]
MKGEVLARSDHALHLLVIVFRLFEVGNFLFIHEKQNDVTPPLSSCWFLFRTRTISSALSRYAAKIMILVLDGCPPGTAAFSSASRKWFKTTVLRCSNFGCPRNSGLRVQVSIIFIILVKFSSSRICAPYLPLSSPPSTFTVKMLLTMPFTACGAFLPASVANHFLRASVQPKAVSFMGSLFQDVSVRISHPRGGSQGKYTKTCVESTNKLDDFDISVVTGCSVRFINDDQDERLFSSSTLLLSSLVKSHQGLVGATKTICALCVQRNQFSMIVAAINVLPRPVGNATSNHEWFPGWWGRPRSELLLH